MMVNVILPLLSLLTQLGPNLDVLALVIVRPVYNNSKLYVYPPVPDNADVPYLVERGFAQSSKFSCLSDTNKPKHSSNHVSPMKKNSAGADTLNFLNGTTYWYNEYLHVGHVPFDSMLMQILRTTRVDRIVFQRASCNDRLCDGLGSFQSFFAGYLAALMDNYQPGIPVYLRRTSKEKEVRPFYVSTSVKGYIQDVQTDVALVKHPSIILKPHMCFENVIRRGRQYDGNFYGSISPEAVQLFKEKAYSAVDMKPAPSMYFSPSSSHRILFSYRSVGKRVMTNSIAFADYLRQSFLSPGHEIQLMNNGLLNLTSHEQLRAVAESNVVITNHGAFEANLIYMRNGSLLIELAGDYQPNEHSLFENFAQGFGVYYSRVQNRNLTSHQMDSFFMTKFEMEEVVELVRHYFKIKPFSFNTK